MMKYLCPVDDIYVIDYRFRSRPILSHAIGMVVRTESK